MARVFHALLALVFLDAFASLAVQVGVLVGRRGLLPAVELLERAHSGGVAWHRLPTLFWWIAPDDVALGAGVGLGMALSVAALLGAWPRACFAALGVLYLSYVTVCRDFLAFQWDNLLVEAALLAVLLPRDRRAPWIHWLFRILLFKLYWESGLAKWQSAIGDWRDGSAMGFYYQTAPLPTWLAWYAHHLPVAWHHVESALTLVIEGGVALFVLGPRPLRLVALVVLTGFQALNAATANYGFFIPLAVALHVFLLDDADLARAGRALRRGAPPRWRRRRAATRWGTPRVPGPAARRLRRAAAATCAALWLGVSAVEAGASFGPGGLAEAVLPLRRLWAPFHAANVYHLFASVTRERVEPEFQTWDPAREAWVAHPLRWKPGPPERAPAFVAPHQPRVDFRLWFYGLSFRRGSPEYVVRLARRLCDDPQAVQPLFASPLPATPPAVRIAFWDQRFSTPEERASDGVWWVREQVATSRPLPCDGAGATPAP